MRRSKAVDGVVTSVWFGIQ